MKARNAVGFSLQSQVITILAAIVPSASSTPITYNDGTNVYIKWNPPSSNPVVDFGDVIRGYRVYIRQYDG